MGSLIRRPLRWLAPWRQPGMVDDAMDVARGVREVRPEVVFDQLSELSHDRLVWLAMTLGALTDPDDPVEILLAWQLDEFALCPAGLHKMTPRNTSRQRNGRGTWRVRCLACDRVRVRAFRRRADA